MSFDYDAFKKRDPREFADGDGEYDVFDSELDDGGESVAYGEDEADGGFFGD